MESHESRAVALSARVYRGCLRAYPAAFRRAYGRDMARVFQDACRDAYHRAGAWGVLLLWGPILRDLVANVTGEHIAALRGREGEIMVVEGRGRSVWLWWAIAGAMGWGLASAMDALLHLSSLPHVYPGDAIPPLGVQGLALGVAQWLIVRRYMPRAGWWAPATIIGVILIAVAPVVAYETQDPRSMWLKYESGGLLEGLVLGVAQWLVLRQHVRRAGWWIVASAVGWLIAAFVGVLSTTSIARMIGPTALGTGAWWPMWFIDAAVLGGLYGALLGRVFVALLRASPRPSVAI